MSSKIGSPVAPTECKASLSNDLRSESPAAANQNVKNPGRQALLLPQFPKHPAKWKFVSPLNPEPPKSRYVSYKWNVDFVYQLR
jgi:hypothetical protein